MNVSASTSVLICQSITSYPEQLKFINNGDNNF